MPDQYDELFPGAISAGQVEREEQSDLGRAVDLSFLGEAAQDPVGTGQEAALELARTGTLGGASLEDIRQAQNEISPLPMEPGTSRASQELPELFGSLGIDPRYLEMQQEMRGVMEDPEAGFLSRMGAGMALSGGPMGPSVPPLQFRPSGVGAGLSPRDALEISFAGLTMHDPGEIAQVLLQRNEDGSRRFPQFAVNMAPDGAYVVTNTENNRQAVINRPGMSTLDGMQALGLAAMYTPAGRATAAMPSTFGRIAVGAGTAGLTEAAIQQGQEMVGGEFDKGDVALSAAVGPVVDLARPAMGLIQRTGRFIGSYMPESITGGLRRVIPEGKAAVLNFANRATEYLQSGRPAIVTTQDAVPEAHTPFRQILLKMVERLPLTGTGGLRKAQQQQRVEVLQHVADRFNLSPNTNYGATVIDDINRNAGAAMDAAVASRRQAVDELAENDIILRDFRLTIRDLIEEETKYGEMANQGLINLLNKARTTVWVGGIPKPGPLPRGFGVMDDWLQRLRMHAGQGSPQVREALTTAADALEADLRRHAGEGGEAGARWLQSMDDAARIAEEAETRSLRSLIDAGEIDQQVIRRTLKRGDFDELNQLAQAMTPEGRQAAQQMILRNALRVGGWRRAAPEELVVDPAKVMRWLETEPVEAQVRAFFPDDQQQMIGGMLEYLRMTEAAQKTGQGVGMAAAGGLPQQAANAMNLMTLGLVGALGNAYQSAPVRNLLLRLYHVKSDVRMKDRIMRELTPLLMAGGRQTAQQWTEDDPQDSVYLSAEFQDASEDTNALNIMMQQLRQVTGQAQEQEAEVASQLEQQLRSLESANQ